LDIILRNQIVDKAKPGDKVVFTGTLIVVPDISQISNACNSLRCKKKIR